MVSIRKLVLTNFRSFHGRHEIELPASGLVLVRGQNKDTRGESGAGKTNILLAIAYAFGYCPHPAKELASWGSEDSMSVEVHIDTDAGPAVLTRGGGKASITIGAEVVKGAIKAVEERLDRLCGVGPSLRETLTYRDQVSPKRFLEMTDVEMKSFLTEVLRLQSVEAEIDKTTKAISTLTARVEASQISHGATVIESMPKMTAPVPPTADPALEIKTTAETLKAALATLTLASDNQEAAIAAVKKESAARVAAAEVVHRTIIAELEKKMGEVAGLSLTLPPNDLSSLHATKEQCRAHLEAAWSADNIRKTDFMAQEAALRAKHLKAYEQWTQVPALSREIEALNKVAASLEDSKCAMCSRTWDEARQKLVEIKAQLTVKMSAYDEAVAIKSVVDDLWTQISSMNWNPDPVVADLKEVMADIDKKLAAEEAIIAGHVAEARSVRQGQLNAIMLEIEKKKTELATVGATLRPPELEELEASFRKTVASMVATTAELNAVRATLAKIEASNTMAMAIYAKDVEAHEAAVARVAASALALDTLRGQLHETVDYVDLLKGFRGKIFDETLVELGVEASRVLEALPNAAHVSIEFKSEYETGSGTTKAAIKPVVYLDGNERRLGSAVSGGQLTSISLAVDLAMAAVVSRRLGCNLNWVILDESFNGHDLVTKQACLEMLQEYARDRLVIIVDHASEVKEMFSRVINVVFEAGKSSVES